VRAQGAPIETVAPSGAERRVIVVGGGVAGITAALDCAQDGAHVTLLEVRPRLGGAAYSFERDGLLLDNGQHVFLRCCTAYRDLLDRLGSSGRVTLQPRLEIPVVRPGHDTVTLRRNRLPAPLHLGGALARYPHIGPRARLRAMLTARRLAGLDLSEALDQELASNMTLGDWLLAQGESGEAVQRLWNLIALPTLNLVAEQASLSLGAFVMQTGLLQSNDAGDIGFHTEPLSEVLGRPALRALREAGVEVRLSWRAERVLRNGAGFQIRSNGYALDADAVIVAVPHARAAGLLADLLGPDCERYGRLASSPIVNVHVVYDRRVSDLEFAAGVQTPVQYVFDRSAAVGLRDGQYLAVSLSGADAEMDMSSDELRERYLGALAELFPRASESEVRLFAVSREHAATFAAVPGSSSLRPGAQTAIDGLALAGAWTDTGWPATLEGAVRSGHAAARATIAALGAGREPIRLDAGADADVAVDGDLSAVGEAL
jgi:squalene-associated FAD-dependent desaturase